MRLSCLGCLLLCLPLYITKSSLALSQQISKLSHKTGQQQDHQLVPDITTTRRGLLLGITGIVAIPYMTCVSSSSASIIISNNNVPSSNSIQKQRCTDIESCREIGEEKVQQELQMNPIIKLDNGVRYKKLKPGIGNAFIQNNDVVDLIFSISRANGSYMYSRGFGYEKVSNGMNFGGAGVGTARQLQSDDGLDSYLVKVGNHDIPIGIEQAILGMRKGEKRRIELPPDVGFVTSHWKPEPTTRRGKVQIQDYKTILSGRGTTQPPFPAPTIWDIEILNFRSQ